MSFSTLNFSIACITKKTKTTRDDRFVSRRDIIPRLGDAFTRRTKSTARFVRALVRHAPPSNTPRRRLASPARRVAILQRIIVSSVIRHHRSRVGALPSLTLNQSQKPFDSLIIFHSCIVFLKRRFTYVRHVRRLDDGFAFGLYILGHRRRPFRSSVVEVREFCAEKCGEDVLAVDFAC